MSFKANFYSIDKKQNSTFIPAGSGTEFDILLKDRTDIFRPVISLQHSNPTSFNYVHLAEFGRYYWITNWAWDKGLWYANCKIDVLATYKSAIGSSVQYVKRAASACDPDIIDVYPRKAGSGVLTTSAINTGIVSTLSSMIYIVGVTSANPGAATIGTTVYYAMSYAGICSFVSHLVSMSYTTFTDITDDLAKWICNPFQWIKSVVVIPVAWTGASSYGWTSSASVSFGADGNGSAFSYNPTGGAYIVTSSTAISKSYTISVPKHPDIDAQHSYLKAEPFSNYSLVVAPFGKLQIPSAILYGITDLYVQIRIDPVTGGGTLYLGDSNVHGGSIAIAESQVGVSLPVDAAVVDLAAAGMSMMVGGAANAASVAMDGGNLHGILSAFLDGALSSVSKVQTISSGGKLCDLGLSPQLYLEYFRVIGQDPINYGYPYGQRATISGFSGYVLCDNAEISISSATFDEQREIEGYMNSGFFYE